MRPKLVNSLVITFFLASFVVAGNQPPRIRETSLDTTPIQAGQLSITITKTRGGLLGSGITSMQVQVENSSAGFITFSPKRLSFVSTNNQQADILAIQAGDKYWPAVERSIAPGARIKEYYALNNRVHLPARLYYDEQLIAVILD
jgi:hypothetical protein